MSRRFLMVCTEPPPTSSGLGTLWAKLSQGAYSRSFQIDFLGPHPAVASPYGLSGIDHKGKFYDLGKPPLFRIASVQRNRTTGLAKLFWSAVRAPYAIYEHYRKYANPYIHWFNEQVKQRLPSLIASGEYHAVGVHVPPMEIAISVSDIANEFKFPFVFVVGDPIGYRDHEGVFCPEMKELQQKLLDRCSAIVLTQPTYEIYYSKYFNIDKRKLLYFSDCFIGSYENRWKSTPFSISKDEVIMHWGQVDPWRPIEGFIKALNCFNRESKKIENSHLKLVIMGKIIDKALKKTIYADLGLSFQELNMRAYSEARCFAAAADYHLVIVSPRHLDNIPSKMIDLIAYRRPILLLANLKSESARMINKLGIGLVCEPMDVDSITAALEEIKEKKRDFTAMYKQDQIVNEWECKNVGKRFREDLYSVMEW